MLKLSIGGEIFESLVISFQSHPGDMAFFPPLPVPLPRGAQPKSNPAQVFDFIGGRTRTRTWDPLIKSQLLYQLSYAPEMPPAGPRKGCVL